MKNPFSILAIMAVLLLAAMAASPVSAGPGKGEVIGVTGIVPGKDLIVHILALVPPGADRSEVAKEALSNQGARAMTKEEFSTISITWDQFSDGVDDNNSVDQYYNDADQPSGVSSVQLTNSQATWTAVATSSFAFNDAGSTTRCPSLLRECKGPQTFDGNNDVAWVKLSGGNILGVTWTGTSIDEADMALNTKFNWTTDANNTNDYDVETVFLHENGHALGLGHSEFIDAIMYPTYQNVARSLDADDIAGVTFKYPATGSVALAVTTTSLPDGTVGSAYNETLTATGGAGSYSWTIAESLPSGLSLNAATGNISGTPDQGSNGSYTLTVTVTDGDLDTASASLSLTVSEEAVAGTLVGVVAISYATSGGSGGTKDLRITLSVADNADNTVEGAAVSITLTNDTSGGPWSGTASTGSDGTVTFRLRNAPDGLYSTVVTGVSADGLNWDNDDGSLIDPGFSKTSGNNNRGDSGALRSE